MASVHKFWYFLIVIHSFSLTNFNDLMISDYNWYIYIYLTELNIIIYMVFVKDFKFSLC